MRTRILAVSCVVLLVVFALFASVAFGADMFTGTWKVNLAKSTYSPGPPPKGPNTVQFQAVNNGLKVVVDAINAAGQKTYTEYTVQFDGKNYPVKATLDGIPVADESVSAKKIDDYTVEFTNKVKGSMVGQTKIVVSKDGKTHTATQTGMTAQGQPVNNTVIVEKQ